MRQKPKGRYRIKTEVGQVKCGSWGSQKFGEMGRRWVNRDRLGKQGEGVLLAAQVTKVKEGGADSGKRQRKKDDGGHKGESVVGRTGERGRGNRH